MLPLLALRNVFWALSTILEVVLLLFLVRRHLHRAVPAFFAYVVLVILQSAVVASSFAFFGASSEPAFRIAWGSQAVIVVARWFAVMEIAKKTLAQYTGIWAFTSRLLILVTALMLLYSIGFSGSRMSLLILNAHRSVELCIAGLIVAIFVFVRYYRVPVNPLQRTLAVGFCLYSSFSVINDSLYEKWRLAVGSLWNYLDMLTFIASLILWIQAVRAYSVSQEQIGPAALPSDTYGELSRKLNSRLDLLNQRLERFFRSQDLRS